MVAVVNILNNPNISSWSAFIDSVPGNKHDEEYKKVVGYGTSLPHDIAKLLFPDLELKYSWRGNYDS